MLNVFPERMLDGSVHTAVLLGLLVLWALTEMFGFVFAGFVVAGYLAALAVVSPMSLLATVLEGTLTYGIVWAIGRGIPETRLWSPVFGRERFLLFIVVSVPVRLIVEGLAAPGFEHLLQPLFDDPLWRGARFFGIGVVLVPLLSNAFWKLGLGRGAAQVGVATALVYAVIRGVLMPFTNFHFGGFELTFESVAMDFLAVPKAYVVLLVVAFVAARNNLRFGWDFGGILVPALLAIIAFTPLKLATTLVEIVVLVHVYRLLLRLPYLRDLDLGGPRRIVSMYLLSYGLKWLIASVALRVAPQVPVSDAFGFGYLVTSLVAVRCVVKGHTGRTLAALLFTTAQGLIFAVFVSLGLTLVLPDAGTSVPTLPEPSRPLSLERSVLLSRAAVRESWPEHRRAEADLARYLDRFAWLLDAHRAALPGGDEARMGVREEVAVRADGARCLAVRPTRRDAAPTDGRPPLWWCGGEGPVLYVPAPATDPDALWMAAWLAHRGRFSGVWVESVDEGRTAGRDDRPELRWQRRFRQIRERFGARPLVALRSTRTDDSHLEPKTSFAAEMIRPALGPMAGVRVSFDDLHASDHLVWGRLRDTDAILTVRREDVDRGLPAAPHLEDLDAWLTALADAPERLDAPPPIEVGVVAAEVVLPVALAHAAVNPPPPSMVWLGQMIGVSVSGAAGQDGLPVQVWDESGGGPRGWGTWVLAGGGEPERWVVAAPFDREEPGTAQVARALFRRLPAKALWLSGHDRRYGAGDALEDESVALAMEPLLLRSALRAGPDDPVDSAILVVRAQPPAAGTAWADRAEGVVLSSGHEMEPVVRVRGVESALAGPLSDWPGLGWEDGRAATASLTTFGQLPTRYLDAMDAGPAVSAWFSRDVLGEFPDTAAAVAVEDWYRRSGVEALGPEASARWLASFAGFVESPPPGDLGRVLRRHVEQLDDGSLRELRAVGGGEVRVLRVGLRRVVAVTSGRWLCLAVAGNVRGERADGLDGCWVDPRARVSP